MGQDYDKLFRQFEGEISPDTIQGSGDVKYHVGAATTYRSPSGAELPVELAAKRLARFLGSAAELLRVMARACGHSHVNQFCIEDLSTFDREMHHLTGVAYGGVNAG